MSSKFRLTSANSINIARLIPQTFYYFNAFAQLKKQGFKDVVFSVPSGNFGNIGAGLLAYKMGLPVQQFIAATNANDTVPRYLETGIYEAKPSIQTYANAMDVGAPSNWIRIMDLFNNDRVAILEMVKAYRFTDEETLAGIKEIFEKFNYVACPHTAIAYLATKVFAKENPNDKSAKVFLSTAHACKFPEVFPVDILTNIGLPTQVESLKNKLELYDELGKDFEDFKAYLLSN